MSISVETINSFEWRAFEEFCYLIYKSRNEYDVVLNDFGADGGADIIFKDKYTHDNVAIVQCKAYSKKQIGVNLVRELLGSMQDFKVQNGLFLTTSSYSQVAKEFAKSHNITLFKTSDILDIYNMLPDFDKNRIANKILSSDYQTSSCASCGVKMVPAVSKSGRNIWKCPNCKHWMFAKKQKSQKALPNPVIDFLLSHFLGSKALKKVAFKLLSICLLTLAFFVLLTVIPKLATKMITDVSSSKSSYPVPQPAVATSSPSVTPQLSQDVEAVEEIKYLYMFNFTNGTNQIVDEYNISGNNVTYRKGSMNISLSKNDIKNIQRIKVK